MSNKILSKKKRVVHNSSGFILSSKVEYLLAVKGISVVTNIVTHQWVCTTWKEDGLFTWCFCGIHLDRVGGDNWIMIYTSFHVPSFHPFSLWCIFHKYAHTAVNNCRKCTSVFKLQYSTDSQLKLTVNLPWHFTSVAFSALLFQFHISIQTTCNWVCQTQVDTQRFDHNHVMNYNETSTMLAE